MSHLGTSLTAIALAAITLAAAPPESLRKAWSAECSRGISTFTYPNEALMAGVTGKVSVTFAVNARGLPTQLQANGDALLVAPLDAAIRKTVFPLACVGRPIETLASFSIRPAQNRLKTVTCFIGFGGFQVIAGPGPMGCALYPNTVPLLGEAGQEPVTVCEILANPAAYANRDVAVLAV